MHVLIVDDDEIALMVLRDALEGAGHQVSTATNGCEAIEALRTSPCRLVISDWEMPEMDGIQLCGTIRREEPCGYVYIILLTSHDAREERLAGLKAGADDFITKPFDPPELLARIAIGERVLSLETRDVAIFAMAKLAESRDPETGSHLERVRSYSLVLARHLAQTEAFRTEITPEFLRLIYLTAPLHDIGKVGIPDCVLLKPGRLSDREFDIMKTHAAIGAQTLDAALRQFPGIKFLQMGRDIAATHHERFDGSGYPAGLSADAIPLSGRIVALADVYDALTSKRVYKSAFGHEVARNMILGEAGSHFDPGIVQAFVAVEQEFIAIQDRLHDTTSLAA